MDKPKLRLNSSDALLSHGSVRLALNNLNTEEVVRVALKAFVAVRRNFVLPVSLSNRRADIVGVKAAIGSDMVKTNDTTILDVIWADVVPCLWACEVWSIVVFRHDRQSLVL